MLPTPVSGFNRTRQIPSQPCAESWGQHSSLLGSSLWDLSCCYPSLPSSSAPRLSWGLHLQQHLQRASPFCPPSPAGAVTHLTLVVNCTPVLMTRGRSGCMGMHGCLSTTKALQEQHRDPSQTSLPALHPWP